jgi:hypothetical protein
LRQGVPRSLKDALQILEGADHAAAPQLVPDVGSAHDVEHDRRIAKQALALAVVDARITLQQPSQLPAVADAEPLRKRAQVAIQGGEA